MVVLAVDDEGLERFGRRGGQGGEEQAEQGGGKKTTGHDGPDYIKGTFQGTDFRNAAGNFSWDMAGWPGEASGGPAWNGVERRGGVA